jgi:hypothetical protein
MGNCCAVEPIQICLRNPHRSPHVKEKEKRQRKKNLSNFNVRIYIKIGTKRQLTATNTTAAICH